ncbi:CDT1-like protein a, chloroplastic [Ricinus communis]|uniref:CDT1 Geminin-binding domain-containing protein n=1 Tax=Ricinus communis TaxID=3988 RepID=B9T2A2_RICCO|nr:CDT1-like protein a, chloroplastic [Ricinus communis]EEF30014.1 conserved hypothetical protein [Ricinus communis]|eukprot:XP_002532371.1 CDT1-like protein a, chloroplastic [Ricinus communis]
MSSSRSSPIPYKSKKPLKSATPKSKSKLSNPIATQTPDKQPAELPSRRLRNRGVALSLKEVRKIAQGNADINKGGGVHIVKSARRQISTWPEESTGGEKSNKQPEEKIPEGYEILSEFFDCLDSTIRLMRLKGSMPTLTNISPKIECLTDRRFDHGHLAQMKYILPEAIEITRVLVFDERSSCMKPDLHVSLNVDAIECDVNLKSESKNLHLRKVFRARLEDFYKAHPEGDEIPKELLPEPFNRSKLDLSSGTTKPSTSLSIIETPAGTQMAKSQLPVAASHFSKSFTRRFSQKLTNTEVEITCQGYPTVCSQQSVFSVPEPFLDIVSSNEETSSSAPTDSNNCSADVTRTPSKKIDSTSDGGSPTKVASFQSTPAKLALTPAKLMSATPALHPPKRCYMSPDDDSTSLANKLVRRPVRTRSLKFESPLKNVEDELIDDSGDASGDDDGDILKILPESLLQSIREKERKAQEERDPAISQAKRRRQMIACLPKLFNLMHFFFQSINRSVLTKEELMHKIIAGHSDIVDRREVEEQLDLLLELVPEWISKKLATSGDSLFCINKMSSPETIRARLEEAK